MRFLPILWVLFLVAMCLSPLEVKSHLHTHGRLHQSYHLIAFFITACLLAWPARSWVGRFTMMSGAAGLAFVTEWLETVVYHNHLEWNDVSSDIAGVVLAVFTIVVGGLITGRPATRRERSLESTPL